jgi:hypothetical protein
LRVGDFAPAAMEQRKLNPQYSAEYPAFDEMSSLVMGSNPRFSEKEKPPTGACVKNFL